MGYPIAAWGSQPFGGPQQARLPSVPLSPTAVAIAPWGSLPWGGRTQFNYGGNPVNSGYPLATWGSTGWGIKVKPRSSAAAVRDYPISPWGMTPWPVKIPVGGSCAPLPFVLKVNRTRARFGDTVAFSFTASETPKAIPQAFLQAGPNVVARFPVPLIQRGLTFGWDFQVPVGTPLGTLSLVVSYAGASGFHQAVQLVELVPGGDSGGRVISMTGYDRPTGRYVLAHLDAGALVQGSNPSL